jgi:sortase A
MTKTGRIRLLIWIAIILFTVFVVIWELQKSPEESTEEPETTEVEEHAAVDTDEVMEPPDEEVEELIEGSLLLPEVAGELTRSGELIGTLIIPSIGLNTPIIADATPQNLNRSPALMKSGHLPGSPGNSIISGHRMYEFGSHFNRLDEIRIGDRITFDSHEASFHFEVEQITFVDPAEIWITMGDNLETRLTLFACTPIRIATHRLVVFAVLKEVNGL